MSRLKLGIFASSVQDSLKKFAAIFSTSQNSVYAINEDDSTELLLDPPASPITSISYSYDETFKKVNASHMLGLSSGNILYSKNAKTWTEKSSGLTTPVKHVNSTLKTVSLSENSTVHSSTVVAGETLSAIIYNGEYWLASTNGGSIAKSSDLVSWTVLTNFGGPVKLNDYGNGYWIASHGSFSSLLSRSTDGVSWSPIAGLGSTSRVTFADGFWIGIGGGSNGYANISTNNGDSWQRMEPNSNVHFNAAYGDKKIRLQSGNNIIYNYSAENNYLSPFPTTNSNYAYPPAGFSTNRLLKFVNNLWFATSSYPPSIGVSTDGLSWSALSLEKSLVEADLPDIFGSDGFYILTNSNSNMSPPTTFFTSYDGFVWSEKTFPPQLVFQEIMTIANGKLVSRSSQSVDSIRWTDVFEEVPEFIAGSSVQNSRKSQDLDTWTTIPNSDLYGTIPTTLNYTQAIGSEIRVSKNNKNASLIINENGNPIFYSKATGMQVIDYSPGSIWEDIDIRLGQYSSYSPSVSGIAYNNGIVVVSLSDGTFRRSTAPDSISWTSGFIQSGVRFDLVSGNGLFVTISRQTSSPFSLRTSTDGLIWDAKPTTSNATSQLFYRDSAWIAGFATSRTAARTTDFVTWTTLSNPTTWTTNTALFSPEDGKYYFGNATNGYFFSTNTTSWSPVDIKNGTEDIRSILYNPSSNTYLSISGGTIGITGTSVTSLSTDGILWSSVKTNLMSSIQKSSSSSFERMFSLLSSYQVGGPPGQEKFIVSGSYITAKESTDGVFWRDAQFPEQWNVIQNNVSVTNLVYAGTPFNSWFAQAGSIVYRSGHKSINVMAADLHDSGSISMVESRPGNNIVLSRHPVDSSGIAKSVYGRFVKESSLLWNTVSTSISLHPSAIGYGAGRWVIAEAPLNATQPFSQIAYSTDLVTWTKTNTVRDAFTFQQQSVNKIIYYNNHFYGSQPTNGSLIKSTDGISWVKVNEIRGTANIGYTVFGIASSPDGTMVAVGANNTIAVSPPQFKGNLWNMVTSPEPANTNIRAVRYGQSNFIALSDRRFIRSTNGVTWSGVTSGTSGFTSTTYNTGRLATNKIGTWVAVNSAGEITRSSTSDGASGWSKVHQITYPLNQTTLQQANVVGATSNEFLSTSSTLSVYYNRSTNGTTWTTLQIFPGGSNVAGHGSIVTPTVIISCGITVNSISTNGGLSWTTVSSRRTTTALKTAYDGVSRFITVGGSGSASTSTNNGVIWATLTAIQTPGSSRGLNDIAYGNGVWHAVGFIFFGGRQNPVARRSTNGTTWSTPTGMSIGTNRSLQAVAYGNGIWLTGGSSGILKRSTDNGISWATVTYGSTELITNLTYGNGVWVGNDNRVSTNNGLTWTTLTQIRAALGNTSYVRNSLMYIAHKNTWVAVNRTTGRMARSTSVTGTWTTLQLNIQAQAPAQAKDVQYGNGVWIAVGSNGQARRSTNGTTWSSISISSATNFNVAYGNGIWVVGTTGSPTSSIWRSTNNGLNWQNIVLSGTGFSQALEYSNGKWLMQDSNGNLWQSTDAVSWTSSLNFFNRTVPPIVYDIASAHNKTFLSMTTQPGSFRQNQIASTTDFVNYRYDTVSPTATDIPIPDMDTDGQKLIIAGTQTPPTIAIISDASDELRYVDLPSNTFSDGTVSIQKIAYGNGKWIIGGRSGQFAHSLDGGESWSSVGQTGPWGAGPVTDIKYGNGKWLASISDSVTNNLNIAESVVVQSTDGVQWAPVAAKTANLIVRSIAVGNGYFVIAGKGGARISTDGIIWDPINVNVGYTGVGTQLEKIVFGNNQWLASSSSWATKPPSWSSDPMATIEINDIHKNIMVGNSGLFYDISTNVTTSGTTYYDVNDNVWQKRNIGINDNFKKVHSSNGVTYIVGENAIYSSTDTLSWTTVSQSELPSLLDTD